MTIVARTALALVAVALLGSPSAAMGLTVSGGGETVITGGNGAADLASLVPVISRFAIFATLAAGGVADGRFECLALAPPAASGGGSGQFTENVMYVAGIVNSLKKLAKDTYLIKGQGRCSGLGAGENVLFEATVTTGGPGATIRLKVSTLPGVEFYEVVTSGGIAVTR